MFAASIVSVKLLWTTMSPSCSHGRLVRRFSALEARSARVAPCQLAEVES